MSLLLGLPDRNFFVLSFPSPFAYEFFQTTTGRRAKPVDVEVLDRMVADGWPLSRIAKSFGVSGDTLVRRFAKVVKPAMHKRDGRPQKALDEKKVRKMIGMGLSREEVAALNGSRTWSSYCVGKKVVPRRQAIQQ